MKKSELRLKDVVDINRGKKLGYIDDVDIDIKAGKIKAVILPSYDNFLIRLFSRKKDTVIEWNDIKIIGEDVVLVDLKEV